MEPAIETRGLGRTFWDFVAVERTVAAAALGPRRENLATAARGR
jgi:hypothetical protein